MAEQFLASELTLASDGSLYHIRLFPEELADNIILVGDPKRVDVVSSMFDSIELKRENREIVSHTGTYKGKRITALSTGMGVDNLDIVITELDACKNIDFKNPSNKGKEDFAKSYTFGYNRSHAERNGHQFLYLCRICGGNRRNDVVL